MDKYKNIFLKLYDSIRLNLGIKKFLKNLKGSAVLAKDEILINKIALPLFEILGVFLIKKFGFHYGADFRRNYTSSHKFDPKRGNLGYGFLHYSMIRVIKPQRLLCVGSMYGYIPAICALACRHNGLGRVDFVDAGYDEDNKEDAKVHNFGVGFWKKTDAEKHFRRFGLNGILKPFIMTNKEFAANIPSRKYDYIYIDGDHSYKGVRTDYELFWPRLKSKGFMVFHDTDNNGKQGNLVYNVGKFMKEKIYGKRPYVHFFNPASGLVIVQKI